MSIFSRHFPLGLGTSRFPISGPDDTEGIEKSIKLVSEALESGITYIDLGYNYSAGMTPEGSVSTDEKDIFSNSQSNVWTGQYGR